jgi:hypothetical protein
METSMSTFGFSLSGNKSKKTWSSQTNATTNTTTTPTLPDWGSGPVKAAADRVRTLLEQDPSHWIAAPDPLQQQAAAGARGLSSDPNAFDWAKRQTQAAADTGWLNPYTQAGASSVGSVSTYLDRYRPYVDELASSSAADLDAHAGTVRAQQALDLAGAGAFGGSGAALTQSMTEGELARARASTLSGLRSHGFELALNAAAGDADRALQDRSQKVGWGFQGQQQQLQAANQLLGLQGAFNADQRANLSAQYDIGSGLRDIQNAQLNAPITSTQQMVAALSGLPLNLFAGQNVAGATSETSSGKSKESSISAGASASFPGKG